ncbi:MAG: bifunctional folylpolyglutamate synthase/dihydrofolate synthase, partial [Sulfuricurvum sp.]|nr:bifunctional folylpolyglutamate synthase/dihydrofolate synthase [Sulfuricurvum sp.]
NAFEKVLSVFTPIDFDHAAFLGTTIESIAGTKLRSMSAKALLAKQPHTQTKSIALRIADEKGSLLMCIDEMCRDEIVEMALQIAIKNSLSDYLRDNLELSMVAFEILGYRVESQFFDQNALFGRLSRIAPNITLDVGHNALAAEAIARSYEGRKVTLIYNTYGDKDYREILSILKPIIESVEIIEVSEGRIVERHLLESVLDELYLPYRSFEEINSNKEYLVFGSFSVAETFLKRVNVTSTMV